MNEPTSTRRALAINQSLLPTLGFLVRLEQWLIQRGVGPEDGYRLKVAAARDALDRITVETHYLSCKHGVGRLRRD